MTKRGAERVHGKNEERNKSVAAVLNQDLMAFLGEEASNLPNKRAIRQVDRAFGRLYGESVKSIYESTVHSRYRSGCQPSQQSEATKVVKVKHLYLLTPEVIVRYCSNHGGNCGEKTMDIINGMLTQKHLHPVRTH